MARGVHAERDGGQGVGQQIDPQQLDGEERLPESSEHEEPDCHVEQLGCVGGEQVVHHVAEVAEDAAAIPDGGDDRCVVVVGEHE